MTQEQIRVLLAFWSVWYRWPEIFFGHVLDTLEEKSAVQEAEMLPQAEIPQLNPEPDRSYAREGSVLIPNRWRLAT